MATERAHAVLAIDPGCEKCGVAVVRVDSSGGGCEVLYRAVLPVEELPETIRGLTNSYDVHEVLVGNGTNCEAIARVAKELGASVVVVDEKFSSAVARKRFFQENPPRGWRRLFPASLLTPWRPYDDYVAVILAERYLLGRSEAGSVS